MGDLQHGEKLATKLLAEGCYGAEHAFIRYSSEVHFKALI